MKFNNFFQVFSVYLLPRKIAKCGQIESYVICTLWRLYKQKLDFYFKASNILSDSINDCRKYIFLTVYGDTAFSIGYLLVKADALEAASYEDLIKIIDGTFFSIPNTNMEW